MLRCAAIACVLVACGSSGTTKSAPRAVAAGACIDPVSFGAVVDDGKDDRAAVQAAFDVAGATGGTVCLPAGDLHISRVFGKIPSLITPAHGITVAGQGAASRLVMLEQPNDEHHRDWWVIKVTGTGHVLRDFSMDGSARGVTDEQTHLIQLVGPAKHITIERLGLSIPVQEISRGGDCIRMLGERDTPVEDVTIRDVTGEQCARSFIAFQRHVYKVLVEDVRSIEIGGGAIDMEPTGDGGVRDVVIRRSDFRRGEVARGSYTVALAGSPDALGERLTIEDCTIEGSIGVYRVHGGVIANNRIVGGYEGRAMIKVQKDSKRIRIENNIIERVKTNGAGIELTLHHGGWPSEVVIKNNEITMRSDGIPIHAEPVENIEIVDNTINCASTNRNEAVFLRGVFTRIKGARVAKNHIRGGCSAALRVSQHQQNVTGDVVVEKNVVEGTRFGVIFENGDPDVKPVVNGNIFKGVSKADHVVGSKRHGYKGTNEAQ